MEIQRAIDIMSGAAGDVDYNDYATAKRIVVAVLREYRKIGTVEQCKNYADFMHNYSDDRR